MTLRSAAWHALCVVAMFVLVSFFFARWSMPTMLTLTRLLRIAEATTWQGVATLLGTIVLAVAVGVAVQFGWDRLHRRGVLPLPVGFTRSALACSMLLLLLLAAGLPNAAAPFGPGPAEVVATLRRESLRPEEARFEVQGYYEDIARVDVQPGPFLDSLLARSQRPLPRDTQYTDMSRKTDPLLERELIPNWSGELAGSRLTVNSQGMRDREGISPTKPANTCRIALVGSSVVMGYGVGDEETFARLLEQRLQNAPRDDGLRYEVLNFGTGMSYAIHRRVLIDRKVFGFQPDAIFYVAHQDELLGPPDHLARLVTARIRLPYPCLDEVVQKAGINEQMSAGDVHVAMQTSGPDILRCIYRDLVAACRQRGIVPVWIYLPMPGIVEVTVRSSELEALAREAGFVVVNLAKWADGYEPAEVKHYAAGHHPNARGHRIIAGQFYQSLTERPDMLPEHARIRR